jgi:hypothetical protein
MHRFACIEAYLSRPHLPHLLSLATHAGAGGARKRAIQGENLTKHVSWDRDRGHLESHIAAKAHHRRADLDQLLAQAVSDRSFAAFGIASFRVSGRRRGRFEPQNPIITSRRPQSAGTSDGALSGAACLIRTITVDGDAVHDPVLPMVIVDRVVLDAAVVPKGGCVGAPAKAQVNSGRIRWR